MLPPGQLSGASSRVQSKDSGIAVEDFFLETPAYEVDSFEFVDENVDLKSALAGASRSVFR